MRFTIGKKLETVLFTLALFGLLENSMTLASEVDSSSVSGSNSGEHHVANTEAKHIQMFGLNERFESGELPDSDELFEEQIKSVGGHKSLASLLRQLLSSSNSNSLNYNSAVKRDTIKRPFNPQTSKTSFSNHSKI
jgi:hypothetical protein